MTLLSRMHSWFRVIVRRSRMETEMDAELRLHIEAYAEDLIRSGVPRKEALRRARIEFGGIERLPDDASRGDEDLARTAPHGLRSRLGRDARGLLTLLAGEGVGVARVDD